MDTSSDKFLKNIERLYKNIFNLMQAFQRASVDKSDYITADVINEDGTTSTLRVNSFSQIQQELNRIDNNFKALLTKPSYVIEADGTISQYQKVSLANAEYLSNFSLNGSNCIVDELSSLEDFIYPMVKVPVQINSDMISTNVFVRFYLITKGFENLTESTYSEQDIQNLKAIGAISYKLINRHLPLEKLKINSYGKFKVTDYSLISLDEYQIRLDKFTYNTLSGINKSLKTGDYLVSSDYDTKFLITNADAYYNQITVQKIAGTDIPVVDTILYYNQNIDDDERTNVVNIPVKPNQQMIIFVSTENERNISFPSNGIKIDTKDFTVNYNGQEFTLQEFYDIFVVDLSENLKSIVSTLIPNSYGIKPNQPILIDTNFHIIPTYYPISQAKKNELDTYYIEKLSIENEIKAKQLELNQKYAELNAQRIDFNKQKASLISSNIELSAANQTLTLSKLSAQTAIQNFTNDNPEYAELVKRRAVVKESQTLLDNQIQQSLSEKYWLQRYTINQTPVIDDSDTPEDNPEDGSESNGSEDNGPSNAPSRADIGFEENPGFNDGSEGDGTGGTGNNGGSEGDGDGSEGDGSGPIIITPSNPNEIGIKKVITLPDNEEVQKALVANIGTVASNYIETRAVQLNEQLAAYNEQKQLLFKESTSLDDSINIIESTKTVIVDNTPKPINLVQEEIEQKESETISNQEIIEQNKQTINESRNNYLAFRETQEETIKDLKTEIKQLNSDWIIIVKNIDRIINEFNLRTYKPTYRIVGMWDIQEPIESPKTNPQKIIRYDVQYRYNIINNTERITHKLNFTLNGEETEKEIDSWINLDTQNIRANENSADLVINQVSLPIERNQSIDIRIRAVSEVGYPNNPIVSDWSNPITINFELDQKIQDTTPENTISLETLIFNIDNDLSKILVDNALTDTNIFDHVDKIMDAEKTYQHKADEIASGFLDDDNKILSVNEIITNLQNKIAEQDATINNLTIQLGEFVANVQAALNKNNAGVDAISLYNGTNKPTNYSSEELEYRTSVINQILTKEVEINTDDTKPDVEE